MMRNMHCRFRYSISSFWMMMVMRVFMMYYHWFMHMMCSMVTNSWSMGWSWGHRFNVELVFWMWSR